MTSNLNANILHLQRLSTEDGPGIRTTIFFKGCPLSCLWCHNPESIDSKPQLQWLAIKCIGCKTCLSVCPEHALSLSELNEININRSLCNMCGECVEKCPSTALEMLGIKINLDDLSNELLKDAVFFQQSNGGITASGGEPTMQVSFTAALFEKMKAKNIHTALDTCGLCSQESFEKLLPFTDLILYDIKTMDPQVHQEFTGKDNSRILQNLLWLCDKLLKTNKNIELWIRTPLIPGYTTDKDNIQKIGQFIAKELAPVVTRWELCAFNNLCRAKYQRLDLDWVLATEKLLSPSELEQLGDFARTSGVNPDIVFTTGATSIVKENQ